MDRDQVVHPYSTAGRIFADVEPKHRVHRIFNALCEHPYGLTIHQLVDVVYGDDLEGGPDDPWETIRVALHFFNRYAKRTKFGLRIWNNSYHGGHGWRYQIWIVKEA